MKRRPRSTNDADRAQLEREAEAELQREIGKPGFGPARSGPARSRASGAAGDRPRAWGSSPAGPAPSEPEAEPVWQPTHGRGAASPVGRRPEPPPPWEEQEDVAADDDVDDEWADDEGAWEDDEEHVPGQPVGLLGVPLDYDATGIALEQLAQRSNVQRPASMVVGVDASEAAQIRDRAMAQFLERQKVRSREDAERAAARAAGAPTPDAPAKRAPFPQLSPGLSAKSLVMQPVSAPPLNLPGATSVSPALVEARAKAERAATRDAAEAEQASRPKRTRSAPAGTGSAKAAKKSSTKATTKPTKAAAVKTTGKAAATKAGSKKAEATKAAAPKPPAKSTKAPVTKAAATGKAGTARKVGTAATRKVAKAAGMAAPTASPEKAVVKKAVTKKAVTKGRQPTQSAEPAPAAKHTGRASRAGGDRPVIRRARRTKG